VARHQHPRLRHGGHKGGEGGPRGHAVRPNRHAQLVAHLAQRAQHLQGVRERETGLETVGLRMGTVEQQHELWVCSEIGSQRASPSMMPAAFFASPPAGQERAGTLDRKTRPTLPTSLPSSPRRCSPQAHDSWP